MSSLASSQSLGRGGLLRRLVDPLVDQAIVDFWLGQLNRLWTWERPLARVVERRQEAADAVTLLLKPNRHWQGFRAGQHLNIGAEVNGRCVTRSYSLSDQPRPDGLIVITVKQVPGGLLSTQLCDRTQVGDILTIGQAYGDLALPKTGKGGYLLLAAGSGITPLMSLIRSWAAAGGESRLTLAYWARTKEQLCFAKELQALAEAQPRFRLHLLLTQHPATPAARIGAAPLDALLLDAAAVADLHVLACGPGGFVETARQLLASRVAGFQAEAFSPATPLRVDEVRPVTVQLQRSGRSLTISSGDSLLGALEAQGLRPASGCRMGICHSCVCTKLEGQTQNLLTAEQDGEPGSALRLCVSRACGNISLDL
ncbi:ferredoxin reductase [Paucibacter sp. APW11]|uniref:Ferredoxin reductase n=1 Tax=Roseateles aquae TaxID=3077235 RepID=A0ABU3P7G8_9BURK|nr:ferredoxin reductase [Paucibacter sp. APW11]MDT8998484.1 ferredoxin reductase [Paucibacter sp. APW11]